MYTFLFQLLPLILIIPFNSDYTLLSQVSSYANYLFWLSPSILTFPFLANYLLLFFLYLLSTSIPSISFYPDYPIFPHMYTLLSQLSLDTLTIIFFPFYHLLSWLLLLSCIPTIPFYLFHSNLYPSILASYPLLSSLYPSIPAILFEPDYPLLNHLPLSLLSIYPYIPTLYNITLKC